MLVLPVSEHEAYYGMKPAEIEREYRRLVQLRPSLDRDGRLADLVSEWRLRAAMGILLDGPGTRLIGKLV